MSPTPGNFIEFIIPYLKLDNGTTEIGWQSALISKLGKNINWNQNFNYNLNINLEKSLHEQKKEKIKTFSQH